jgi:GTP-binding protein
LKIELAHDAAGPPQFPRDGLPEVAVAGRSNVGKSTFINALVGRRKLARASATPGKTRRIHFYRIGTLAYLVDLPGYGYAAVSRDERAAWRPLVESYLRRTRSPLRGVILLIDLRRGPQAADLDLLAWLAHEQIAAHVVLTKADKLKATQLERQTQACREALGLPEEQIAIVSAKTGRGMAQVGRWVQSWTGVELRRADGGALAD